VGTRWPYEEDSWKLDVDWDRPGRCVGGLRSDVEGSEVNTSSTTSALLKGSLCCRDAVSPSRLKNRPDIYGLQAVLGHDEGEERGASNVMPKRKRVTQSLVRSLWQSGTRDGGVNWATEAMALHDNT
jgi:hypothetical protein